MRDRATLDFIRDRVLAEIRANPPKGPLLGETAPRVRREACSKGHVGGIRGEGRRRRCRECAVKRKRDRRAKGLPA